LRKWRERSSLEDATLKGLNEGVKASFVHSFAVYQQSCPQSKP
jgi:hypothetical protein